MGEVGAQPGLARVADKLGEEKWWGLREPFPLCGSLTFLASLPRTHHHRYYYYY